MINWDQTGTKFVPVSHGLWRLREASKIEIRALDDKRGMTTVLACALSGKLLPPQLLYGGKTEQCHPRVKFPEDWDVWHSPNHWSNEASMLKYYDTVIILYVTATRQTLNLPTSQPALALFDVFAAHHCETVLDKLRSNNILCVHTSFLHWGAPTFGLSS